MLAGCSFVGPIPETIGSLTQLASLYLNANKFNGPIPPSLGNLSKLYVLDLSDNELTGTIPVSNGSRPGLDMLINTKHFHFGKNRLYGEIPSKLFNSSMALIHVLFESNHLTGPIPSSLGLVQKLEVVRLDRNSLSGSVPPNLNNLTRVSELHLSNNKLTGPMPNLTGMNSLNYVDISNNTFDLSDVPPWFSTLQSLTTLMMEHTQLQGQIPVTLFSLPNLQTLLLKNNLLNGTLDIGSSYSNQLKLIDLQDNSINDFRQKGRYSPELILVDNPICEGTGVSEKYCTIQQSTSSYSTPNHLCVPVSCSSDQISSPHCICAYPYMGTLSSKARSFSDMENSTIYTSLEESLMSSFRLHGLPVDSVSLSNSTTNLDDYFVVRLQVFPYGQDRFNRTGISEIGFVISSLDFNLTSGFATFIFIGDTYGKFAAGISSETKKSSIVGVAIGGSILVLLFLIAGFYAVSQKRRAEIASKRHNPFASWNQNESSGGIPQLKGARYFSFEELRKCTKNFAEANYVGCGGYGKVHRGTLPSGQLVAIKRAQRGSMQGGLEFKTEIELLSRIHHKNVVNLLGFCFEQDEQILIYEYIANGTLKDSLSGKSGVGLDWMRRLRIALGAARGLQYMHDLANPPVIHRDVKSNNILLDECLNAKVADFGLSKPMGDAGKGHITTQVKGTMGYFDPEYYTTGQLTEKSDVYSFGVLMLELITARRPIEKGIYIVREVERVLDKTKSLYNLHGILDPSLGSGIALKGVEKFTELAMRCVEKSGSVRPTMGEVVKEIESIMQLAGLNPNADSASTSASYEGTSKGFDHPFSNESLFSYSGAFHSQS